MRTRSRRPSSAFRQNWKFMASITVVAGVTAMGIAIATQGLEGMMRKASLAFKAMDNPSELSGEEKGELKKMIMDVKDKSSAKKQFESLSAEQKAQAKQQFNQLDEAEKKKLKALFGRK